MSQYYLNKALKILNEHDIVFDEWIDIDDDLYHSLPGLSSSGAKYLDSECPLKLKYNMDNKAEKSPSEALLVGRAIHKYILEVDDFENHFVISPTDDKRSREWKVFANNLKDDSRELLRKKDGEMLAGMLESLSRPKDEEGTNTYTGIITNSESIREKALFTIDKENGIVLKVKVDINLDGMFLDLKSTRSAKPSTFSKDIANMGYALQAAFYLKVARLAGKKASSFGFIPIEKEPPYMHSVMLLPDEDIKLAMTKVDRLISKFAFCLNNNSWYGYDGLMDDNKSEPLFTVAPLPAWYRYSLEEENGFEGP
jgi:hypothetical protein